MLPVVALPPSFKSKSKAKLRNALRAFAYAGLTASCLSLSFAVHAQEQSTPAATDTKKPQLPHPTTTVEVHENAPRSFVSDTITAGTLDGAKLAEAPIAATTVTREVLSDQNARVLSDVVKNDASIGEDYAPVGYYGDFEIRGFPIDLATGLQINGMTIAGEQDVPLENKERVEFVKGIAGVESGVTSAGGLINFVTKRPALITAMDAATDHRGSAFGNVDLGRQFGAQKQVGARVNLAGERMQSYVNGADGWRAVGAGAADWKINPLAILKTDFEYQHKVQRSVAGYQLLGGTTVPDLNRIYASNMLGEQSWAKPNTFDTFNTSARFDYSLPKEWRTFFAGSYSHSLIDDNVIYPYGNSIADPSYFFAPDGTYDIYDYRNPGELRIDKQAEALVLGRIRTGAVLHEIAGGGTIFGRSVQMPSTSVYDWIGEENIYQPNQAFPIETNPKTSKPDQAGPRVLYEDNHQAAAVLQDRVHLPGRIQLLAGGRFDSLRDHNPMGTDQSGNSVTTDKKLWLPQYAVTFTPVDKLMLYGNYSVMLSLGPQAPWWAGSYYLPPYNTRQAEIGAKYMPTQNLLVSMALFHMRAPFFYPKADASGNLSFVSEGHETHDGAELNVEGTVTRGMKLTGSIAAIKALSNDTGTPEFDNKQVINVPRVRTTVFADVAVPHLRGLYLMPGWSYTARKAATRDDVVSVPGYNIFNLGARYMPGGEKGRMTYRLYADNVGDKRYWKDTGASYGDTFIHLGAPTTVRMSAHYTF